MIDNFFEVLGKVDEFYWSYIGFGLLMLAGMYFTYKSGFFQIRVIRHLPSTLRMLKKYSEKEAPGVSPIRLYFASIGGMIGLGNIIAVMTAIMIGGPGALFWLWIAAFVGMIIKYTEIFVGVKYRQRNENNGYDGGIMFCLPVAFKGKLGIILANISAFLLCIYAVEIYQFTVITDTLNSIIPVHQEFIIVSMLILIIYIGLGGIKRMATLCTFLMPIFILLYVILCMWVVIVNIHMVPEMVVTIFKSAFVGYAPVGGFAGSTFLLAAQQGAARAVYSGDIGIGFDSIIQAETKTMHAGRQARLAILATITDAIICTFSIVIVYLTGLWQEPTVMKTSIMVQTALSHYIPYSESLVIIVIFLAGFTTLQAYFAVGLKSAKFLSPRFGKLVYFVYAALAFWFFAHHDQTKVYLIMSIASGLLILVNISCILRLRNEIRFDLLKEDHEV